ncbi:MAG TPA: hypothetical protein VKB09_09990 [Thermomicrobiales bacterium]|nr:hypothetical protein [Thermomicrobiales bacterium]
MPDSGLGAQNVESADLPAWSFNLSGNESDTEVYPPLPPRSRRTTTAASDRSRTGWPNLRDSLRGSSAGATTATRSSRRSSSYPAAGGRDEVTDLPPGDRLDDDRTWSDFDEAPSPFPEETGYVEPRYPVRRASATRSRQRARRSTPATARPQIRVPVSVAAIAASQDRAVLGAVGISLFSLLMMTAMVTSRSDALSPWIVTHLDAAGNPDRWGTSSTVWRLPLMTAMLTLANLIGALFFGRRDPFAARFLVAAALLIHLLAWVGLVRILW